MVMMLAAASFIFAGCEEDELKPQEEAKTPVLTITTEDFALDVRGGENLEIEYILENPADGGTISAEAGYGAGEESSWISDIITDTEGSVFFTVAPNIVTEERSATITVIYTYGEGETVSDEISVTQEAADPLDPSIDIPTSDKVSAAAGEYTLDYTILNPVEGGTISAEVTGYDPETADGEGWLSVSVSDGEIFRFTVEQNTSDETRQGTITVTYTYGDKKVTKEVTITQDSAVSIRFVTEDMQEDLERYIVAAGGNDAAQIRYDSNIDGTTGGSFSCTVRTADGNDADWITDVDTEDVIGYVKFSASANDSAEERSAILTLTYTYGDGLSASDAVTIVQEAGETVVLEPEIIVPAVTDPVPAEGAETYTIGYVTVKNANGGKLSATFDVDWIRNFPTFSGEPDAEGRVYYSVIIDENTGDTERSGKITFSYTSEDGKTAEAWLEIRQEAGDGGQGPVSAPVFEFNNTNTEFGNSASSYAISTVYMPGITDDEFDSRKLSITSDQSWISPRFDGSWNESGKLAFDIAFVIEENASASPRTAQITLSYIYDDSKPAVTGTLTITQEGTEEQGGDMPAGGEYPAIGVYGYLLGSDGVSDNYTVTIMKSENEFYYLDIYTAPGAGTTLPAGTYTFDPTGIVTTPGTIGKYSSRYNYNTDENYMLTSGSFTVTDNGDGTSTIDGYLTETSGATFHLTYTGTIVFELE